MSDPPKMGYLRMAATADVHYIRIWPYIYQFAEAGRVPSQPITRKTVISMMR